MRIGLLRESLERLRLGWVQARVFDVLSDQPLPEELPAAYDRVLLDIPCSNTGVLGRRRGGGDHQEEDHPAGRQGCSAARVGTVHDHTQYTGALSRARVSRGDRCVGRGRYTAGDERPGRP